jgi:hypothetical protein
MDIKSAAREAWPWLLMPLVLVWGVVGFLFS